MKGGKMAKILVVDDAAFMRMRCSKLLSDNGFEVAEAADGEEAIERYRENRPDGVLMDITLPNMDGLSALQELLKVDPGARIAMVTAMGQQSMVMEALKTGARDFVVKPFDADRLLAAVRKIMS
jgi:two-component system chemotaxis response regulator CheY